MKTDNMVYILFHFIFKRVNPELVKAVFHPALSIRIAFLSDRNKIKTCNR